MAKVETREDLSVGLRPVDVALSPFSVWVVSLDVQVVVKLFQDFYRVSDRVDLNIENL